MILGFLCHLQFHENTFRISTNCNLQGTPNSNIIDQVGTGTVPIVKEKGGTQTQELLSSRVKDEPTTQILGEVTTSFINLYVYFFCINIHVLDINKYWIATRIY